MIMKNTTIIGIAWALFFLVPINSSEAKKNFSLRIHLPREITVGVDDPNLGQIAVIRGEESIKAIAENISVGHISMPGQSIVIDRSIILGRLASSGISILDVQLTGAEKTIISREHRIITGKEFTEAASVFLKKNLPMDSICQFDVARVPNSLVISGEAKDIEMSCRLITAGMKNQGKVIVSVLSDSNEIGIGEVTYNFKYKCRKLVAKVDIPQGQAITAENVNVEADITSSPEPAEWKIPYGFTAKRLIAANSVIVSNMISPVIPEVLIKRNQGVVIKIDRNGLLASAMGKAMEQGSAGEIIKVQNTDSKVIIMAKVNEDGTVEPVF
jgi:flagella basal body P-ring formation protein FlgA